MNNNIKISKKYGNIRIIGGFLKNHFISINPKYKIRPTTNNMKETLFNWINDNIKNSNCLDCFSGSGSLGIEAISRYAKSVTLVDNNKNIIYNLKKNLVKLNIFNKITIIHDNIFHWLKKK